jgi:hypothetical protein
MKNYYLHEINHLEDDTLTHNSLMEQEHQWWSAQQELQKRGQRVLIVNQIILEIASRGRKFFHHEDRGHHKVAQLVDKNEKIYYRAEYGKKELICLSVPYFGTPKYWFHGHTLLCLVKEFRDYIKTGKLPVNTLHKQDGSKEETSFSGLYSQHWAYPESDMEAIREKAKELGYLK